MAFPYTPSRIKTYLPGDLITAQEENAKQDAIARVGQTVARAVWEQVPPWAFYKLSASSDWNADEDGVSAWTMLKGGTSGAIHFHIPAREGDVIEDVRINLHHNNAVTTPNLTITTYVTRPSDLGDTSSGDADTLGTTTYTTVGETSEDFACGGFPYTVASREALYVSIQDTSSSAWELRRVEVLRKPALVGADPEALEEDTTFGGSTGGTQLALTSAVTTATLTSGAVVHPLDASEKVAAQFLASHSGTIDLSLTCAMTGTDNDDVTLALRVAILGEGDARNDALGANITYDLAPDGENVVIAAPADWRLAVKPGQLIFIEVERLSDNNADTLQVLGLAALAR